MSKLYPFEWSDYVPTTLYQMFGLIEFTNITPRGCFYMNCELNFCEVAFIEAKLFHPTLPTSSVLEVASIVAELHYWPNFNQFQLNFVYQPNWPSRVDLKHKWPLRSDFSPICSAVTILVHRRACFYSITKHLIKFGQLQLNQWSPNMVDILDGTYWSSTDPSCARFLPYMFSCDNFGS